MPPQRGQQPRARLTVQTRCSVGPRGPQVGGGQPVYRLLEVEREGVEDGFWAQGAQGAAEGGVRGGGIVLWCGGQVSGLLGLGFRFVCVCGGVMTWVNFVA